MVKPKFELEIINKIETENQLRHCMNMDLKVKCQIQIQNVNNHAKLKMKIIMGRHYQR